MELGRAWRKKNSFIDRCRIEEVVLRRVGRYGAWRQKIVLLVGHRELGAWFLKNNVLYGR